MLLKLSLFLLVGWSVSMSKEYHFGEWIHLALFFSIVAFFVWVLMEASCTFSRE